MTLPRFLIVIVVAALVIWGAQIVRDPYRTKLPFGTTDVSSIQSQLDKLKKQDRELVLGYLERSHGDVLPAKFADPDAPFTARTVAQAIDLQRKFLTEQAKMDAKFREIRLAAKAKRDKALAPLRETVTVELVRREILPRSEALARPVVEQTFKGRPVVSPIDTKRILVTTYRLQNLSNYKIASLTANVDLIRTHPTPLQLSRIDGCYITHSEPITPGESIEVRCANIYKDASAADQAYVDMPESEFELDWEPRLIQFENGGELKYSDY